MAVQRYGTMTGAACWDLGTHFGIYTVGMAMAVGSAGQVAGFEPDPVSFERCKQHTMMSSLTWVKLFNVAASDVDGELDLIVDQGSGATTSHLAYEDESHTETTPVTRIRSLKLDSLVSKGEIRPPNFIKVDVEGHGHKALKGAMESIKTSRPVIVMSFHSAWEVEGVIELLRPLKYQPYTCEGSRSDWPASSFCQTLVLQR
jgi:FkbM family methyltransferase